jgi:hypothetical protein
MRHLIYRANQRDLGQYVYAPVCNREARIDSNGSPNLPAAEKYKDRSNNKDTNLERSI